MNLPSPSKLIGIVVATLSFLLLPTALAAPVANNNETTMPSGQAQRVLASVRSSVLQIKTIPIGSDSTYGYGSGFAVGFGGLIVTNYHVVSAVVMSPDRYRLEFLKRDGTKGTVAIVAIDLVHDLAVVRGDTGPMPALGFAPSVPDKGTRGYSIGFPQNLGLTVTEGIVNGLSEDSVSGSIHFSGAVNSGMSGGPAVNGEGRVFGVNVSSMRDSQLISFVVPASAVTALLARAKNISAPTATVLFDELAMQLKQGAIETLNLFPQGNLPVQNFGHFQVPTNPGKFAQCNASNDNDADKLYSTEMSWCDFKDTTYVQRDLFVGSWTFVNRHISAPDFGPMRLASLAEGFIKPDDDTSRSSRTHKKRWACQSKIVSLAGTRAKTVLCLRRYSQFEDLYDIRMRLVTLDVPNEALVSSLFFDGFPYPEAMALMQRFMGAIVWKP